ncbi:g5168 [Coccomyxa elongata]
MAKAVQHGNLAADVQTGAASGHCGEATLILEMWTMRPRRRCSQLAAAPRPGAVAAAMFVSVSTDFGLPRAVMQLLHRMAAAAADTLPCVLLAAKDDLFEVIPCMSLVCGWRRF